MQLAKPFNEATSSARVDGLPPELSLGLGVEGAPDLRHHSHAAIADQQLGEPDWHLARWLRAEDVCEQ
jgi:hypothetical protein